jgi:hydroxycarboxylate dehydrogenase B
VALLAIRNSFHLGRIGHWAEQCARGGFASIHFVNVIDHAPLQAPYGGAEARFSTNPFCAALPGEDGPAVLLDMATSKIAIGKARVARNRGVPVPEDSLLDAAGRPTRDPAVMFEEPRGALIPMGEHKGSGLAIVCELLAGALTGGWTTQPAHPQAGGIINNMLSVSIDPDVFGDRRKLLEEIGALITYVKSARPRTGFEEVLVPGEPERRRRAERLAHGIDMDERTWAEILGAAQMLGIADQQIDGLPA